METSVINTSANLELSVIIWNKLRILKWDDFKRKYDSNGRGSAIAAIGFESKPIIEHIKVGSSFKFKIKEMQLNTIFIPDFSWVIKNISKKNSALLLKHEQGHFDLAEEITRKTRLRTANSLRNRVFNVKGKNEYQAKKDSILRAAKIRKKIEDELQNELKSQETEYDDKTNHGLITKYQKKYDKRFEKLRA